MTISTTGSRASFNGNGVTVAFAFPYLFFANADLDVYLVDADGVVTTQVLDTDYTVTGAGNDAGGTVTMVVPPTSGERLVVSRVVSLTQETDYISGDAFPAETHEQALDRLTMQTQQLQDQITRTLTAPASDDTSVDLTLPVKADRLDKVLSFDAVTGDPETVLGVSDIQTLNDNVTTILDQFNNANSQAWSGINFDTVAPAGDAVARLKWNDTDGTLDLGLKGGNVTLQLGQETILRVLNNTGSGFTDGQVVYVTGASGQRTTVALAQANDISTSDATIGVVTETIANNAQGFITFRGIVRGIDTSSFSEGAAVYLSPSVAGGITSTRPSSPNHVTRVGWVVRSHATLGSILVDIQNGARLDVDQTWTGSQRGAITTDNDLSFDLNGANNFTCTPSAGGTLTFTNIAAGQSGFIKLVNGSNYAIAAAATTKITTADLTKISATGTYIMSYFSDGTNTYVMASGNLA